MQSVATKRHSSFWAPKVRPDGPRQAPVPASQFPLPEVTCTHLRPGQIPCWRANENRAGRSRPRLASIRPGSCRGIAYHLVWRQNSDRTTDAFLPFPKLCRDLPELCLPTPSAMGVILAGACIVPPVIVGYTIFAYRVFWGEEHGAEVLIPTD
jgi:hypothetical protein